MQSEKTPTPEGNSELGTENSEGSDRSPDQVAAEMQRKFENTNQELQALKSSLNRLAEINEALVNRVSTPHQAKPEGEGADSYVSIFDDEKKYAQNLEERISKRVADTLSSHEKQKVEQQQAINQLIQEYPELGNPSSDLYKKAVEAVPALPKDLQNSPMGYKTAVYQAAAQMGLKPKSMREASPQETFSFDASRSTSKTQRRSSDEIPDDVIRTAQALGVNVKDKAMRERLQKASQRQNWTKYQRPGGAE